LGKVEAKAEEEVRRKSPIGYLDFHMLRQMFEKTMPKVELALIDWKGLGKDSRDKLIRLLKEIGLDYERK